MSRLPSGLSIEVADEEIIVRFAFSRRKELSIAEPPGCLKPAAFLPNPNRRPLETSVFRHRGEPESELVELAGANFTGRHPKGAGALGVSEVRGAELDVVADEEPPNGPLHANIVGWQDDADPKLAKAAWKEKAVILASKARLVLNRAH